MKRRTAAILSCIESHSKTRRGFSKAPTVERVDDRFDYGEHRVYAIGLVNGLEITVIYTDRKHDERRIIRLGVPNHMNGATTGETLRA